VSFYVRDEPLFIKDHMGFLFALVFTGFGTAAILFPQWFHGTATPEQAARDRAKVRKFGFLFLPLGVLMLLAWFLRAKM
jgi:hypothetical protein